MEADTNEEACVGKSPASMVEASPFEDIGLGASLPPFVSDPALAPILEPRNRHKLDSETRSIPAEDRPGTVIKTIVGLLLLMFLAYLGGHKQVLEWERRLGIAQVITAGLPFIVLGMIARMPSVGILTDPVLTELSPVLRIGLSSVGFVAGFRFNANKFHGLPKGTASVTALVTLLPAATVVGATAPLLLLLSSQTLSASLQDPVFIRDALILATCGAMTARSAVRWLDAQGQDGLAGRIIRLEELAGVLGIAFIASFFRPADLESGWQIPYVAWFLITIGLGATLGIIFYSILQWTPRGPDFLAMTLGAISFAAGAAGYLHLSSVAVAFIAGVMLANFPGTFQPRLLQMLKRLERPIYLVSLFVIGALWQVDDWRGWALMPVFMASRLFGKWLAATVAGRRANMPVTAVESRVLAISPIGTLAIAIVVNAQLLYPGGSISLIVSAVIGGGVLTEAFVQLASRSSFRIAHLPYDHPLYVPMGDMDSVSEMPTEKRP
jgi:hypothetical protein